jgi:hypothetical protein
LPQDLVSSLPQERKKKPLPLVVSRHCGLDPQSALKAVYGFFASNYKRKIAGQARNDGNDKRKLQNPVRLRLPPLLQKGEYLPTTTANTHIEICGYGKNVNRKDRKHLGFDGKK